MGTKKELTVANMQWHVDQLAAQFDIEVIIDPTLKPHEARAVILSTKDLPLRGVFEALVGPIPTQIRGVQAPPISEETGYVVILHEFGHHLAPNGFTSRPEPKPGAHPRDRFEYYRMKLVAEEAAWEWARYYIEQVFYWTTAMEQVKQYGLTTYQRARRGY